MSAVISISAGRPYGVARVCRLWNVARAGVSRGRGTTVSPVPRRRPGPQGPMPDADLVEAIRQTIAGSPFHGEGYRKIWARLRHGGLRTSKRRVRRLMRENGLAAATRSGSPRGPRSHDGTIIPETINAMWGTDMTAAFTRDHGQVAVFVAVDHCSAECVGVHAARRGTRGSAVEDVVHHEAAGSGDAGDDLGEVGGAPGGQRTQRCRLDAHRVLPAAVLPGDAWREALSRPSRGSRTGAPDAQRPRNPNARCRTRSPLPHHQRYNGR